MNACRVPLIISKLDVDIPLFLLDGLKNNQVMVNKDNITDAYYGEDEHDVGELFISMEAVGQRVKKWFLSWRMQLDSSLRCLNFFGWSFRYKRAASRMDNENDLVFYWNIPSP